MTTLVPRWQFKSFLNTSSTTGDVWSLIGEGVPDSAIDKNPEVTEEHYIHESNSRKFVTKYAPTQPVVMTAYNGDPVFEFVDAISKAESTYSNAETEIVDVRIYETSSGSSYPATKHNVAIAVDRNGGPGNEALKLEFTIHFTGDPTQGWFNPSTLAFTSA